MGAPAPITTSLQVTFFGDGSGVVGELGLGNLHMESSGARNRFKDLKKGVARCRESDVQYKLVPDSYAMLAGAVKGQRESST